MNKSQFQWIMDSLEEINFKKIGKKVKMYYLLILDILKLIFSLQHLIKII